MCLIVRVLLSAVFEGVVSHDISRDANASLVSTVSSTIIQRIVRKCSNGALLALVYQRLTHSQITYALYKLVTQLLVSCSLLGIGSNTYSATVARVQGGLSTPTRVYTIPKCRESRIWASWFLTLYAYYELRFFFLCFDNNSRRRTSSANS
jgi:hypothetical protein